MSLPQTWKGDDPDDEFDEYSGSSPSSAEVAARMRADADWVARERAEHEVLALSLEEEIEALLETMKRGEVTEVRDTTQAEPPGWPDL